MWLFPSKSSFMLLKNKKNLPKCFSTLVTAELFSPCIKYHVFVNFQFGGINLSTLNTHTANWLFVFKQLSMPCTIFMCFAMAVF